MKKSYSCKIKGVHKQWISQMALVVKNLPANAGGYMRCRFNPWVGKITATCSSVVAWRLLWTEELGKLHYMGLQSQTWLKWLSTHTNKTLAISFLSYLWLYLKIKFILCVSIYIYKHAHVIDSKKSNILNN